MKYIEKIFFYFEIQLLTNIGLVSIKRFQKKSPPSVKRVARDAGYKPALLGQRLKALAFALPKPLCFSLVASPQGAFV